MLADWDEPYLTMNPQYEADPIRALARAEGSYRARARAGDGPWHRAAAYWAHGRLEAHLLEFSGDLYGERLTVECERFIRAHEKIDDLARLRAVIAADVEESRK